MLVIFLGHEMQGDRRDAVSSNPLPPTHTRARTLSLRRRYSSLVGVNPTFLTNYAWWTNPWRYGHRWSGLAANEHEAKKAAKAFGAATVPHALTAGKRKHAECVFKLTQLSIFVCFCALS